MLFQLPNVDRDHLLVNHPYTFFPSSHWVDKGINIADSVVKIDNKGRFYAHVESTNDELIEWADFDTMVGMVEVAQICKLSALDEIEPEDLCEGEVLNIPMELDAPEPKVIKSSQERFYKVRDLIDLESSDLTLEEKELTLDSIANNNDIFALEDAELGCSSLVEHSIETGDARPIRERVRHLPWGQRKDVESHIEDMIKIGVVQPSSSSWAFPIVPVLKKDGTMRVCVDYRSLNAITRKDAYPLPRCDDLLDAVGQNKAKFFTSLDLMKGYYQIMLDKESMDKSAFICHMGLFRYTRMPFGLTSAPATFQRLMSRILKGVSPTKVHCYIDDILITTETLDEHLKILNEVLDRLRQAGLRLRPDKCHFIRPELRFLGYIVSKEGLKTDPNKIQTVVTHPIPAKVKDVRSFYGLCSYYRRFIKGFATLAKPLAELMKKDAPFDWGKAAKSAFEALQKALTTAPVLQYPSFGHPYTIETDASSNGLGAVLTQPDNEGVMHPIAYASRSLNVHESRYSPTDLEGLGVVWALKNFESYISGTDITVITDHAALKTLMQKKEPSGRLYRWTIILQEFNPTIIYRAGAVNVAADALSRIPRSPEEDELAKHGEPVESDEWTRTVCAVTGGVVPITRSGRLSQKPTRLVEETSTIPRKVHRKLARSPFLPPIQEPEKELELPGIIFPDPEKDVGSYALSHDLADESTLKDESVIAGSKSIEKSTDLAPDEASLPQRETKVTEPDSSELILPNSNDPMYVQPRRHADLITKGLRPQSDMTRNNIPIRRVGAELAVAKSLPNPSRLTTTPNSHITLLGELSPEVIERIKESQANLSKQRRIEQLKDPRLLEIIMYKETYRLPENDIEARRLVKIGEGHCYYILNGVLYYDERKQSPTGTRLRYAVPKQNQAEMLQLAHESSGHMGPEKTHGQLKHSYRMYWSSMFQDSQDYCNSCVWCATRQGQGRRQNPPLTPIPVPKSRFYRLAMDVLSMPKSTEGCRYILVVMCYLTKWITIIPLIETSAKTIANVMLEKVFLVHGPPAELLSDQGSNFTSALFQELCKLLKIIHVKTTIFHPQSDGMVERANRSIQASLAKMCKGKPHNWQACVPSFTWAYNTTPHSSTGITPFEMVYGTPPKMLLGTEINELIPTQHHGDVEQYLAELRQNLHNAWKQAGQLIESRQAAAKRYYDVNRHVREPDLKVGDRVWMFVPYEAIDKNRKMSLPWHGPCVIRELQGSNAKIQLVSNTYAYPIITVNIERLSKTADKIPADAWWVGNTRKRRYANPIMPATMVTDSTTDTNVVFTDNLLALGGEQIDEVLVTVESNAYSFTGCECERCAKGVDTLA